jgi:ubiquinone/menaquinone biosynthesis C-methylase UbiE
VKKGRELLNALNLHNTMVLDLACGSGRYWEALSPSNIIVGVDLTRAMLDAAKSKTHGRPIHLVLCDAEYLPLADKSFDAVISVGFLGNKMAVTRKNLSALRRLLRPNGILWFSSYSWLRHFDQICKRLVCDLFHLPISHYPPSPYAETITITCLKLRLAGFTVDYARSFDELVNQVVFSAARGT